MAAMVLWAVGLVLAIAISYAVVLYLGAAAARGEVLWWIWSHGLRRRLQVFALAGALTASLVFKQVVQDFLIAGFARGVPIRQRHHRWPHCARRWATPFSSSSALSTPPLPAFMKPICWSWTKAAPYFKEGAIPPRGWERWLAPDLLALTRKERLQLRRRTTTGRLFAYLSFIILAIALYNKAGLPAHYMAVFPTLVIAVFANPWRQLYHPRAQHRLQRKLALSPPSTPPSP